EEAATGLLEHLSYVKRDFTKALEISPRGNFFKKSLPHLAQADFDENETLQLSGGDYDLAISNLALHHLNDVPGALIQIRRALKPDGFFLATLLGGDTLHELRASLYEAETEIRGGISPRVAPFMDLRDSAALLQRASFALPVATRETLTFIYPDIFALMKEL